MESGLKNAWIVAALKSGLGLLFVGALVAIRMVTATPTEQEPVAESSNRAGAESSDPSQATEAAASRDEPSEPSLVARAVSRLKERVSGGEGSEADGDRMVSCRIRGRVQFMTADDCAVRGGTASRLGSDR